MSESGLDQDECWSAPKVSTPKGSVCTSQRHRQLAKFFGAHPVVPKGEKILSINATLRTYFESTTWDVVMAAIVALNLCMLVIETDASADDRDVPLWAEVTNTVLLIGFAIEVLSKMIVYGWEFWYDPWNVSDFTVVGLDVVTTSLESIWSGMPPSVSMIRILRVIRIGKSIDFLMMFPELGMMLTSLAGAVKSIFWGCILLVITMMVFSILAVQIINPVNKAVAAKGAYDGICDRCPHAFESVWSSFLTFFQQLIAGDSWGVVSLPIIAESPACFLFFAAAFFSLQTLVTNVILALVVESAQLARDSNMELLQKQKEKEQKENQKNLVKLCNQLDKNSDGVLSFEEIMGGFHSVPEFSKLMQAMDVHAEDMVSVWGLLDHDRSGYVDYREFAEQLFKLKARDTRTMIVFIKYHVTEIRDRMMREFRKMQENMRSNCPSDIVSEVLAELRSEAAKSKTVEEEEKANKSPEKQRVAAKETMSASDLRVEFKADLQDAIKQIERKMDIMRSFVVEDPVLSVQPMRPPAIRSGSSSSTFILPDSLLTVPIQTPSKRSAVGCCMKTERMESMQRIPRQSSSGEMSPTTPPLQDSRQMRVSGKSILE